MYRQTYTTGVAHCTWLHGRSLRVQLTNSHFNSSSAGDVIQRVLKVTCRTSCEEDSLFYQENTSLVFCRHPIRISWFYVKLKNNDKITIKCNIFIFRALTRCIKWINQRTRFYFYWCTFIVISAPTCFGRNYILVTDLFCSRGFVQIFMRILRLKTEIVWIAVIWFLNIIISTHSIVTLILQSNGHKKTVRTCKPSLPAQTCNSADLYDWAYLKKNTETEEAWGLPHANDDDDHDYQRIYKNVHA